MPAAYVPEPTKRIPHPRVEGANVLVPEVILAPNLRFTDQPWAESRVLNCLRGAQGRAVTTARLIDAMVAGDPDGGCRTAHNVILHVLWRLRKRGFPIEQVRYGEYAYRVTP